MMQKKLLTLPISYFSITLGLFAIGLGWRQYEQLQGLAGSVSSAVLMASNIIWLLFVLFYVAKFTLNFSQVKKEFLNQVQCCFFSLIPITLMLFSLSIKPSLPALATVLIALGTVAQLLFAAYRSAGLWRGGHPVEATTPILYLPTVAANFVSAIALKSLDLPNYAMLFFGMGMISWLTLEPAILQRLRNATPVAEESRPILSIQLAPAFVAVNTYLHIVDGKMDYFALALIGYGLLQLLFLLRLLPWIVQNSFKISFWGFSFGLASMATAGVFLMGSPEWGMDTLGFVFFVFGSACIALLVLGTLVQLLRGKFFPA
ncbi:dicarboxylate transporter/tellurite-resistance protein TehA [Pasteurellaceae bacterium TAE3-ERU1]|nr:dicarboxylate transporter/tellurite-resistance protein TehA [Pasteurellaceae bacterium TAE3-ERU1]